MITPAAINTIASPLPLQTAEPSALLHQGSGATFSFKLPEPPQVQAAASYADSIVSEPTNWGQMVQRMAMDVNQSQATAAAKVQDVLAGGTTPVHDAMIAVQESGVKFQMLSEVRNKVLEAYQEVMRMQV